MRRIQREVISLLALEDHADREQRCIGKALAAGRAVEDRPSLRQRASLEHRAVEPGPWGSANVAAVFATAGGLCHQADHMPVVSANHSRKDAHNLSPGELRRCASRARSARVEAAYRVTIVRVRHPASIIRSDSWPPSARNVCAK